MTRFSGAGLQAVQKLRHGSSVVMKSGVRRNLMIWMTSSYYSNSKLQNSIDYRFFSHG